LKVAAKREAIGMWLACYTLAEIAEQVAWPLATVADWIASFSEIDQMDKTGKANAEHVTDFKQPIYNVWKQQTKTPGKSHFGNSEVRWLDNLLYLYTDPFSVVSWSAGGSAATS